MLYAVGKPGQEARFTIVVQFPEQAEDQVMAGEVAVLIDEEAMKHPPFEATVTISSDGESATVDVPPTQPAPPIDEMQPVRQERDARLAASDWSQMEDVDLTADQKEAWRAYRAALRSLPEDQPDATLATVKWPVAPA